MRDFPLELFIIRFFRQAVLIIGTEVSIGSSSKADISSESIEGNSGIISVDSSSGTSVDGSFGPSFGASFGTSFGSSIGASFGVSFSEAESSELSGRGGTAAARRLGAWRGLGV